VANPDTSISRRVETINPLQALYFMNSPFLRSQAEAVLHRPDVTESKTAGDRITMIYRRVLSRDPDSVERELADKYIGSAPLDGSGAKQWTTLVQGLLLSNEFMFVD
jgi:hypothetical protein